jgi:hypothetical protein
MTGGSGFDLKAAKSCGADLAILGGGDRRLPAKAKFFWQQIDDSEQ